MENLKSAKEKLTADICFCPFKSLKCRYIIQLRYELFTMNLQVTEVAGQVLHVFTG